MEGLNCAAFKSQEHKGGSERRINAWTVLGIFGMCMSTDIYICPFFYKGDEKRQIEEIIKKKTVGPQGNSGDKREEMK